METLQSVRWSVGSRKNDGTATKNSLFCLVTILPASTKTFHNQNETRGNWKDLCVKAVFSNHQSFENLQQPIYCHSQWPRVWEINPINRLSRLDCICLQTDKMFRSRISSIRYRCMWPGVRGNARACEPVNDGVTVESVYRSKTENQPWNYWSFWEQRSFSFSTAVFPNVFVTTNRSTLENFTAARLYSIRVINSYFSISEMKLTVWTIT